MNLEALKLLILSGGYMKRICVYCGSSSGTGSEYLECATKLGKLLAEKGIELVYGGAEVGLMGAVASAAMNNGGKVIGIIPEAFADKVGKNNLTEFHVVPTMHERKKIMFDLSDGFIALPGGFGTLEEVFEILTWAQLGFHAKPCGVVNVCGYYDKLLEFLDHSVSKSFIKKKHRKTLLVSDDLNDLIDQLERYDAPIVGKWD
jgi:hypothetical protein